MDKEHSQDEIWNAVSKAASHDLTGARKSWTWNWFRQNGFKTRPYSRLNWYLYHKLEDLGLRFELPYQERYYRMGQTTGQPPARGLVCTGGTSNWKNTNPCRSSRI